VGVGGLTQFNNEVANALEVDPKAFWSVNRNAESPSSEPITSRSCAFVKLVDGVDADEPCQVWTAVLKMEVHWAFARHAASSSEQSSGSIHCNKDWQAAAWVGEVIAAIPAVMRDSSEMEVIAGALHVDKATTVKAPNLSPTDNCEAGGAPQDVLMLIVWVCWVEASLTRSVMEAPNGACPPCVPPTAIVTMSPLVKLLEVVSASKLAGEETLTTF